MMKKLSFVLGLGVGYVLGTRAGRERYEQISRAAQRLWQSDPVQHRVEQVTDAAGDAVKKAAPQLGSLVTAGVKQASKLVSNGSDGSKGSNGSRGRGPRPGGRDEDALPGTVEHPAK